MFCLFAFGFCLMVVGFACWCFGLCCWFWVDLIGVCFVYGGFVVCVGLIILLCCLTRLVFVCCGLWGGFVVWFCLFGGLLCCLFIHSFGFGGLFRFVLGCFGWFDCFLFWLCLFCLLLMMFISLVTLDGGLRLWDLFVWVICLIWIMVGYVCVWDLLCLLTLERGLFDFDFDLCLVGVVGYLSSGFCGLVWFVGW